MSYGTRSNANDEVLCYVYDCDCCNKHFEAQAPDSETPAGWERKMVMYGPIGVFIVHCPECIGIADPAEPPGLIGAIARKVLSKIEAEKKN